jgi:hypothetical protein
MTFVVLSGNIEAIPFPDPPNGPEPASRGADRCSTYLECSPPRPAEPEKAIETFVRLRLKVWSALRHYRFHRQSRSMLSSSGVPSPAEPERTEASRKHVSHGRFGVLSARGDRCSAERRESMYRAECLECSPPEAIECIARKFISLISKFQKNKYF